MVINKKAVIKNLLYILSVIILLIMESNVFSSLKIFQMKPNLILCAVVSVAVIENEKFSAVFGLIVGFIFDCTFGTPFMLSGIFYFFTAYLTSYIVRTYFNRSFFTAFFAFLPVCFLKEIINMFYLLSIWDNFNFMRALLMYILPEYIYTATLLIPVYFYMKFVSTRIVVD